MRREPPVTGRSSLLHLRWVQVAWLGAAMAGLALGHMALAQGAHLLHAIHVSLVALYLAPVLGAALWFGLRGGVLASALVTVAFSIHVRLVWPEQPVDLAERGAFLAVFWVVGIVAGVLVDLQGTERARARALEQEADRRNVLEAMASLAAALGSHDPYTRAHGERVAEVAAALGAEVHLDPTRVEILRLAGLVHDIGKLGVPDDTLLKPGELSPDERISVQRHPDIAAGILQPLRGAAKVAEIVRSHHECPDGSGYPRALRESEISVEARLLRVADVFCSLVDARPYKPALPVPTVLAMMESMAGAKLDAAGFQALQAMVARGALSVARPGDWQERGPPAAQQRPQ
jgi:putative nucleotidyltransferase with HDIG domain